MRYRIVKWRLVGPEGQTFIEMNADESLYHSLMEGDGPGYALPLFTVPMRLEFSYELAPLTFWQKMAGIVATYFRLKGR